jgi:hypothetical protein
MLVFQVSMHALLGEPFLNQQDLTAVFVLYTDLIVDAAFRVPRGTRHHGDVVERLADFLRFDREGSANCAFSPSQIVVPTMASNARKPTSSRTIVELTTKRLDMGI